MNGYTCTNVNTYKAGDNNTSQPAEMLRFITANNIDDIVDGTTIT